MIDDIAFGDYHKFGSGIAHIAWVRDGARHEAVEDWCVDGDAGLALAQVRGVSGRIVAFSSVIFQNDYPFDTC